jgi:Ca2+-transporting ATPase
MLTGDHRETAQTIAREVGLLEPHDEVIDGVELDHMPDDALAARAARLGVVSRVSPEGKLRLVAALQERGAVVAMLGDGINDAAALKKADIGVAMGGRGTDAAKEVAGIVLQDDRFPTIAAAVEEGRVVFDNIRKFVFYLFSCNLAEILTLLGAGLIGLPLPVTPLQILWMNLLVALPALALALEPADVHVLRRHPRPREAAILSAGLVRSTMWYALVIGAVTLAALWWALREHPGELARTVTVSFTTLALAQLLHLGNARSRESVANLRRVASNRYALAALLIGVGLQVATVLAEPLRRVLGTVPLSSRDWLAAVALGILPGLMGQVWKELKPRVRRGGQPRQHMARRAAPS